MRSRYRVRRKKMLLLHRKGLLSAKPLVTLFPCGCPKKLREALLRFVRCWRGVASKRRVKKHPYSILKFASKYGCNIDVVGKYLVRAFHIFFPIQNRTTHCRDIHSQTSLKRDWTEWYRSNLLGKIRELRAVLAKSEKQCFSDRPFLTIFIQI
jgi:hypothetical protein